MKKVFLNFVKNLGLFYQSLLKRAINPKNRAKKMTVQRNTPEPKITANTVASMSQPSLDSTLGLSSSSSYPS